jgi:hypothetical protein
LVDLLNKLQSLSDPGARDNGRGHRRNVYAGQEEAYDRAPVRRGRADLAQHFAGLE